MVSKKTKLVVIEHGGCLTKFDFSIMKIKFVLKVTWDKSRGEKNSITSNPISRIRNIIKKK